MINDITVNAGQDFPKTELLELEIHKENEQFSVWENGMQVGLYGSAEKAVLNLHEWINYRVFRAMPDLPRVHAGCATFNGKRIILAGDKAAGKTTLLCRLLFDGMTVHGDEHVLLDGMEVLPFPRKFHLKEGTLAVVPELKPICSNLRSYPSYFGGRFYFFDPVDAGCGWTITKEKLDVIVHIKPNHGGRTTLELTPKYLMVHSIMRMIDNFSSEPNTQIQDLCRLVDASRCYTLCLGNVVDAAKMIKEFLS